uniref:Uncharacterized protein n=1 Tax=Parascaris univalens TaxID=6257 RepID=A0A914ZYV9_PARUN
MQLHKLSVRAKLRTNGHEIHLSLTASRISPYVHRPQLSCYLRRGHTTLRVTDDRLQGNILSRCLARQEEIRCLAKRIRCQRHPLAKQYAPLLFKK